MRFSLLKLISDSFLEKCFIVSIVAVLASPFINTSLLKTSYLAFIPLTLNVISGLRRRNEVRTLEHSSLIRGIALRLARPNLKPGTILMQQPISPYYRRYGKVAM